MSNTFPFAVEDFLRFICSLVVSVSSSIEISSVIIDLRDNLESYVFVDPTDRRSLLLSNGDDKSSDEDKLPTLRLFAITDNKWALGFGNDTNSSSSLMEKLVLEDFPNSKDCSPSPVFATKWKYLSVDPEKGDRDDDDDFPLLDERDFSSNNFSCNSISLSRSESFGSA